MEDSDENSSASLPHLSPLPLPWWSFILVGIGLLGLGFGFYQLQSSSSPSQVEVTEFSSIEAENNSEVREEEQITVDVSGAVKNPGVYSLPISSRIKDAINLAGGWAEDANAEFISQYINLSEVLTDQMKIYIPSTNENSSTVSVAQINASSKISINSASADQLETLAGIGEARAQKIIDNRPYKTINDLVEKKILTTNQLEKIISDISL